MLKNIFLILLVYSSSSFAAETKTISKLDYTPCLKALNEKSIVLKGKITPLDSDGWTYVVKGDDGSMTVISENGTYKLQSRPVKCTASSEVNSIEVIQSLVVRATAFNNDPENSDKNKKEIFEKCKTIVNVPKTNGAGFMMGSPSGGVQ